jgi:membrane-associated phospholipid phosphatase
VNNPRKNHYTCTRFIVLGFSLVLAADPRARAQTTLPDAPKPQPDVTLRDTPLNLLHDQAAIWTSPAHVHTGDLEWMVPLAAVTGLTIATDRGAMTHVVSKDPNFNQTSLNASNALVGGFIAAPVALFGWGAFRKSPRAREAGILSGEAMIDGVVVEQGMKLIFWRERPTVDNAKGKFFQSSAGIDSSFPSSHSVVAWSAAAVLVGEYPSRLSQVLIYSAATGVSLTRVMGQQHFPTDVIVGSVAGWLVGHHVFRKHHKESPDYAEQN